MYSDEEIKRMFPLEQHIPFKKLDKLRIGKKLPRRARFMFNSVLDHNERNSLYNDYIKKALGQEISGCCSKKTFNTAINNIPSVLHLQAQIQRQQAQQRAQGALQQLQQQIQQLQITPPPATASAPATAPTTAPPPPPPPPLIQQLQQQLQQLQITPALPPPPPLIQLPPSPAPASSSSASATDKIQDNIRKYNQITADFFNTYSSMKSAYETSRIVNNLYNKIKKNGHKDLIQMKDELGKVLDLKKKKADRDKFVAEHLLKHSKEAFYNTQDLQLQENMIKWYEDLIPTSSATTKRPDVGTSIGTSITRMFSTGSPSSPPP